MRLNVPSTLAVTEVTSVSVASYKLTVTTSLASTCPASVPELEGGSVAVDDPIGVAVCVCEAVAVGDSLGVDAVKVGVAVGGNASHV